MRAVAAALAAALLLAGCAAPVRRVQAPVELASPIPAAAPNSHPENLAHAEDSDRSGDLSGWRVIGTSSRGRPIEAVVTGEGPSRVLIVGGIHGDEPEGGRTIAGVEAFVRALRPRAAVMIVRDANPDGTAAGRRNNARGVDINRNWPASNFRPGAERGASPLSEPETIALHGAIEAFSPDLIIVCHASHRGPFVNFDGPAAEHATRFASAAAAADPRWRVVPNMGYPTPGSMGSMYGVDRGMPILTIEFDRGHDAALAWAAMRDGLGALLAGVSLAK